VTRVLRALLCAGALLLVLASAATAASRDDIIRDCADDGRLDGKYTQSEIRDARRNLPTDVDEYTDCRDVLRRAELPSSGGSGSSGSGGTGAGSGTTPGGSAGTPGSTPGTLLAPSSPEEVKALSEARKRSADGVSIGDDQVVPGAAGFATGASRHDLPWPLLVVLILIGVAALAAAVAPIRRRVLPRHRPA
jgi:hypothetical protein